MDLGNSVQKVTINTSIDVSLLKKQKQVLLDYAEQNHMLYGLVYLIDSIQDSVYDQIVEEHGKEEADEYAKTIFLTEE